MKVRVLAGFVDARANYRSYVPGDVVDIPKAKAVALAASGHVEIVDEPKSKPASKPKVGPAETKPAAPPESKVVEPPETK